ncbi:hypothetical protein CYMTET_36724, partial [Cymbomonas tetramitiformis]
SCLDAAAACCLPRCCFLGSQGQLASELEADIEVVELLDEEPRWIAGVIETPEESMMSESVPHTQHTSPTVRPQTVERQSPSKADLQAGAEAPPPGAAEQELVVPQPAEATLTPFPAAETQSDETQPVEPAPEKKEWKPIETPDVALIDPQLKAKPPPRIVNVARPKSVKVEPKKVSAASKAANKVAAADNDEDLNTKSITRGKRRAGSPAGKARGKPAKKRTADEQKKASERLYSGMAAAPPNPKRARQNPAGNNSRKAKAEAKTKAKAEAEAQAKAKAEAEAQA